MTEQNRINLFQRILAFIQAKKLWPYVILVLVILLLGIYLIVQATATATEVSGGEDLIQSTSSNNPDALGTTAGEAIVPTATVEEENVVQGSPTITRRPTSTDQPRSFRTFTPTWDGLETEPPEGWTPTATQTATHTPEGWTPSPTPVPDPLTVELKLTADPTSINEPGGTIVYTVTVNNTYSDSVEVLSLTDSIIADLSEEGTCNQPVNPYPTALAAGDSYTCSYSIQVLGDPEDIYENTVTLEVQDALNRTEIAADGAQVSINDVLPAFNVSKTASAASVIEPGELVTFTIEVTNTSVEPLRLIQILDDLEGNLNGVGSCDSNRSIPVGGTYSCEFAVNVTGAAGDTYTNIVSVRVLDDEYNGLTQTAEESVEILPLGTATVTGQVRFDLDGDGNMSDPDPGLQGVLIELEDAYCTPGVNCPVEITDEDGRYTFTNVAAGGYLIIATDLPNYYSTNDSAPPNDNKISVAVAAGVVYSNNDFIDAACPSPDPEDGYVSGTNPSDDAIVSLTVDVIEVAYSQPMSQSGSGSVLLEENYQNGLANLSNGGTVPFTQITYDPGINTVTLEIDTGDEDWLPGSTYGLEILSDVENSCGEPQGVDVVRSFSTMSAISGQVREDTDGDGDLSDDDPGIPGVTIELEDGTCVIGINCPTTVTDTDGEYEFTDLSAGDYLIRETDPAGYDSSNDADGGDFNQISVVGLEAFESITGMDFLDKVGCSNPDPVTGFVSSTDPSYLQTGVVLSSDQISVVFNQPMMESGSGSVTNDNNYSLRNATADRPINITDATYDATTYTAYVTVNTSTNFWRAGNWYHFTIEAGIQNSCGVSPVEDLVVWFQTAP